jgi:hypothetical protein
MSFLPVCGGEHTKKEATFVYVCSLDKEYHTHAQQRTEVMKAVKISTVVCWMAMTCGYERFGMTYQLYVVGVTIRTP